MIDNHTVTAVLFVFNEELFLPAQLDSILGQTCSVDSIIVVDDQSIDGTKDVILRYQDKYPQIQYHWNESKGKVNAYEKGLRLVNTDLFFICAGDDQLYSNFVEYLYYKVLVKHNVKHAYGKYNITNQNLVITGSINRKRFYAESEILYRNMVSGYLFGRREIIESFLPLPSGLEFEDWYTAIKLTLKYGKSYISDKALFNYRRHAGSATTLNRAKSKYLGMIARDVRFLKMLVAQGTLSEDKNDFIRARIIYFEALLNYSFQNSITLCFGNHIRLYERLKLLFFPIICRLKYGT